MTRKIRILDTTLRDGEQAPGASMGLEGKLVIARELLRLGVDAIEAGFPMSSPGDFESVRSVGELVGDACMVMALTRALESDIDAAADALSTAQIPCIHTGLGVSESHLRNKLHMSREDCLARVEASVSYARSKCDLVQFYAEDAARADKEFLARVCETAIKAGATAVNIPDTTGYSLPQDFAERIRYLRTHVEGIDDVVLSVHCHNDLGMATALSLAGVAAGAMQVECTINGLGERAGNTAMEEVVMAIALHGEELDAHTDIDTREFVRASRLVQSITGMKVQANKAIVGANAFAHSSGIHQDGVLKERETYEIIDPETVGAGSGRLVLTARSGHAALRNRLEELGYSFDRDTIDEIYERFLAVADRKRAVYDEEIESIVNEYERQSAAVYTLEALQVSTGFPLTPTVTLTLSDDEGSRHTVATVGDGPINAAYDAVNQIVGLENDLTEYVVQAVTRGTDAIGEVTVRIAADDRVFVGHGADPDIVVSSVRAYLNALNRALIARRSTEYAN